jgi:8-amino-7-oxononanoate synthase
LIERISKIWDKIQHMTQERLLLFKLRETANQLVLKYGLKSIFDPHFLTPIVPLIFGNSQKVIDLSCFLKSQGVKVSAIRPPTVPLKTDRLRLSLNVGHQDQDLRSLFKSIYQYVELE